MKEFTNFYFIRQACIVEWKINHLEPWLNLNFGNMIKGLALTKFFGESPLAISPDYIHAVSKYNSKMYSFLYCVHLMDI